MFQNIDDDTPHNEDKDDDTIPKHITVDNDDDDTDTLNHIHNLEKEMDDVYGTSLLINPRQRRRTSAVQGTFFDNTCAKYRDKQPKTNANMTAQLHVLSPIQYLKEYARIYATLHC